MIERRRALLHSTLRTEPDMDRSNRDIITLSFRYKDAGASGRRFNRRFSASTTTVTELLDYVESLELKPLLQSTLKLQLDFPLRVICRFMTLPEATLFDLGIESDSVVHIIFDDDGAAVVTAG